MTFEQTLDNHYKSPPLHIRKHMLWGPHVFFLMNEDHIVRGNRYLQLIYKIIIAIKVLPLKFELSWAHYFSSIQAHMLRGSSCMHYHNQRVPLGPIWLIYFSITRDRIRILIEGGTRIWIFFYSENANYSIWH